MTLALQIKLEGILTRAHTDYEKGLNARAYFKVSNHETGEDFSPAKLFMKTWIYLVKGGKIDLIKHFFTTYSTT